MGSMPAWCPCLLQASALERAAAALLEHISSHIAPPLQHGDDVFKQLTDTRILPTGCSRCVNAAGVHSMASSCALPLLL